MNNVKRTWVNYGQERDWTSPQQGQVGWGHRGQGSAMGRRGTGQAPSRDR